MASSARKKRLRTAPLERYDAATEKLLALTASLAPSYTADRDDFAALAGSTEGKT